MEIQLSFIFAEFIFYFLNHLQNAFPDNVPPHPRTRPDLPSNLTFHKIQKAPGTASQGKYGVDTGIRTLGLQSHNLMR